MKDKFGREWEMVTLKDKKKKKKKNLIVYIDGKYVGTIKRDKVSYE